MEFTGAPRYRRVTLSTDAEVHAAWDTFNLPDFRRGVDRIGAVTADMASLRDWSFALVRMGSNNALTLFLDLVCGESTQVLDYLQTHGAGGALGQLSAKVPRGREQLATRLQATSSVHARRRLANLLSEVKDEQLIIDLCDVLTGSDDPIAGAIPEMVEGASRHPAAEQPPGNWTYLEAPDLSRLRAHLFWKVRASSDPSGTMAKLLRKVDHIQLTNQSGPGSSGGGSGDRSRW